MPLLTLFSANTPVDCHILKGRLESEGITCFIHDENIVWVHPFRAVAVGGVKLKVPTRQFGHAQKIMELIPQNKLFDQKGEYNIDNIFTNEIERQNEIIRIKKYIRENPSLLKEPTRFQTKWLNHDEVSHIMKAEKEFYEYTKRKFIFTWKEFWYELFDFDRSVFRYLRTRPVEYYMEKDLVEQHFNNKGDEPAPSCPNCNSQNVRHDYAIDYKWDVLYIILSLLVATPFPLTRKKYHCFHCGYSFKNKSISSRQAHQG